MRALKQIEGQWGNSNRILKPIMKKSKILLMMSFFPLLDVFPSIYKFIGRNKVLYFTINLKKDISAKPRITFIWRLTID